MRHRKLRGFNQALHGRLRQGKFDFTLPVIKIREIGSGQGRQRKTAASGTHQHPIAFQLNGNLRAFGQAAADIKEFSRRNGRCTRLMGLNQRNARHHFHFEVRTGQRQRAIRDLKQQVTENWQRRTTPKGPLTCCSGFNKCSRSTVNFIASRG